MPLTTGLWAHWSMDEAADPRLDSSPNGRDITSGGSIASTPGKISNALSFVGSLGNFFIPADTIDWATNGITISFWYYTSGTVLTIARVQVGDLSFPQLIEVSMVLDTSADPSVSCYVKTPNNSTTVVFTEFTISQNSWHYITAKLSAAGCVLKVDDVIKDSNATPIPSNPALGQFFLEHADVGSDFGRFDELSIWTRVLSDAEDTSLWNSGAGLAFASWGGGATPITASGSSALNNWADSVSTSLASGYTYETFAALKLQLANRLQDPSKIFWTDTELTAILAETLRTFSFLTWHWRDRGSFATVASTSFYDLTSQLPTLLARTLTDRNLINDIEYHFQEPATSAWAGGWTGTDMFNMDDIAHALQKRRNKFLADTGTVITRLSQPFGVSALGRISLPDYVIDVRRLARTSAAGIITNLWRLDEEEVTSYLSTWPTAAAQDPSFYSILSSPPLTVQLAPAPTASPNIDMLCVATGADFIPTFAATLVGVPDDMAWIVKWGAMADLLQKDGPAQDPERANYCEKRYQHGIELARMASVITAAKIGSTQIMVWPLADLDAYQIGWQSATAATPTVLATAGLNYIALSPPPSGATTITLDVIKNAPIPASDSENIQIGREMVSTILDYAEHLAMFKVAGDEWKATEQLFTQFMTMTGNYNSRMNAASKIWNELRNVTNAEEPTRFRLMKLDKGASQ